MMRIDEGSKIFVERNFAALGYSLYLIDSDGKLATNMSVTFEERDEAASYTPPTAVISRESAQQLMDSLWDAGVKPSGGEGHTAHIRALNAHLQDMRQIAFKGLE